MNRHPNTGEKMDVEFVSDFLFNPNILAEEEIETHQCLPPAIKMNNPLNVMEKLDDFVTLINEGGQGFVFLVYEEDEKGKEYKALKLFKDDAVKV